MNARSFRVPWPLGLALAVLASPLGAQAPGYDTASERDRAGSYVGPFFGGVSVALSGQDPRLDFSTGVQWERVLEGGVFLRSGVLYTGRGGSITIARYVEFPVLIGYRLPDDVPTRVFGMAGLQLGILTSCKRQYQQEGVSFDGSCGSLFGSYETFDLGAQAGGGISIALGQANLVLDFRLLQGLRSVDETGRKNRGVMVGAAYMLPLGHHM